MKQFEIKNLQFKWNKKSDYLFNDISLSIEKNKITTIVGKNGSGKSTLIKLISRLIKPGKGDILFEGKDIRHINRKDWAKNISYVSQNHDENIPLQVIDIVKLGNYPHQDIFHNSRDFTDRARNAIKLTGIEHIKHKDFQNLSGGEKQKVMIARAICQSKNVMLLDEPTSQLDIKNEIEIMKLLKRFVIEEGMTCIIISHNFNLVSMYSDDVILLDKNKIIHGKKEAVFVPDILQNIFDTPIGKIELKDRNVFYY